MSGFEVIGVVLGVLPLLVEGLKSVSSTGPLSSVRVLTVVVPRWSQDCLSHDQI